MKKRFVYTLCKAAWADGFPHQPQLQTVSFATALHRLVTNVQTNIVEFVLLEQVRGIGAVTVF